MMQYVPLCSDTIHIHTGNMLTINEVKRKAGQTTTEELVESLKFVLSQRCKLVAEDGAASTLVLNKDADYSSLKLHVPEDRKDIKVSMKIFVCDFDGEKIREGVSAAIKSLNTPYVESVVLALRGGEPLPFETIQKAWVVLEEFALNKQVFSIGVSDVETEVFIALYEWAKVKPGIVQINLAHCCVVPPALQSFTREHEVQLLTHSDSSDILPNPIAKEVILGESSTKDDETSGFKFSWATRYQVHIKCRGVLSSKGYIVCLKK